MRLFIAICFDENMLDSLTEIQEDLMSFGVKGNFTHRENLHMTLAFIGEYDDPEQVVEVMQKVPLRSFSIKLSGFRSFKDMIFADMEENDNLRDYVKRLRKALVDEEIPFDRKKFRPHITLARRSSLPADLSSVPSPELSFMTVDGFSLFRSDRGKLGMIYTELGRIPASPSAERK